MQPMLPVRSIAFLYPIEAFCEDVACVLRKAESLHAAKDLRLKSTSLEGTKKDVVFSLKARISFGG
jgi:hypothetical protein